MNGIKKIAAALNRIAADIAAAGINGFGNQVADQADALDALAAQSQEPVYMVFDGWPGPEGPRFIEAETSDGRSIRAGEWSQYGKDSTYTRLGPLYLEPQPAPPQPAVPEESADRLAYESTREDLLDWKRRALKAEAALAAGVAAKVPEGVAAALNELADKVESVSTFYTLSPFIRTDLSIYANRIRAEVLRLNAPEAGS